MKTRRMFLIALCGAAMLIGASSCKKEKQENENGETMTIKASLSSADNNSKTHLDGKKVMWDTGDAFKLFTAEGTAGTKFSLTRIDGQDGKVAYFEGKHPGDAPYYACYPFNNVSCTAEGKFTFSIPQVQNDSPETVSGNSNAGPMVGYMEKPSGALVFKNVMSWLKVGLIGDVTIKRVTLTDNDGKPLNGTLTVSDITVGDDGTITGFKTAMTGGSNQLEIVSNEGFPLDASRYTYFWFQVPEGSLERLKLAAYTSTANDASDVLNLEEKQISGGINGNTILTAEVQKMVLPPGVLPGLYTVDLGADGRFGTDDDRKVFFSQSNLYWDGNSFNFETNQWDFPDDWYSNHVGFFFWSKTASVAYAKTYSDSGRTEDDIFFTNEEEETPNPAFHVNGETGQNQWRVLSADEWYCLLRGRTPAATGANNYKTLTISGTANTVKGVVILPDKSTTPLSNIKETDDLAKYNAVFFPATGARSYNLSMMTPDNGQCWASSPDGSEKACYSRFWPNDVSTLGATRQFGFSIRLVRDAK